MSDPSFLDRADLFTALSDSRRGEVEALASDLRYGLYHLDLCHVFSTEEMYQSVLRSFGFPRKAGSITFDSCLDWARELRGRRENHVILCVTGAHEFLKTGLLPAASFFRLLTSIAADLLHVVPTPPQHRVRLLVVFLGTGQDYPVDVDWD